MSRRSSVWLTRRPLTLGAEEIKLNWRVEATQLAIRAAKLDRG
jgi:hypothetical protein